MTGFFLKSPDVRIHLNLFMIAFILYKTSESGFMNSVSAMKEILIRTPLFRPEWKVMLDRMREHPHAPKWNTRCGDRLEMSDLPFIGTFRRRLYHERENRGLDPPEFIYDWVRSVREHVRLFDINIGNIDIRKDFSRIRPMTREDLVLRLAEIVPADMPLNRLIVNDTSGTTGHPLKIPNHPKAIGCYDPMVTFMLERYGVRPAFSHDAAACFLICAQQHTITYCTVHSGLNGAGYAKINLKAGDWPFPESPAEYIRDINPFFLAGDPLSFHELMKIKTDYRPNALLSTAMSLTPALREIFMNHYSCPVIDMYSLNDTGPVGYSCPLCPDEFHILPTDLHVEIIDESGNTLHEGESGEITVTGGRNPFVPLLRYRTGDRARIKFSPCGCGDPMPRFYDFQGRAPVFFRNDAGKMVNPADISKIIRRFPVIQFQFHQYPDLSCRLAVRGSDSFLRVFHHDLRSCLAGLFGTGIDILLEEDPDLGQDKKIIPFISENTV